MHIQSIRVRDFGTIGELDVDLTDGLNVISGPNEAGKSTLMRAVWFALTRKCSSQAQEIREIEPNGGGTPEVEVTLHVDGTSYALEKVFDGQRGSTSLRVDHSNGSVEDYSGDQADEVLREALGFGEGGGRKGIPQHFGFWPAVWVTQENREIDPGKHLSSEGDPESISSILAQIGGDVLAGSGAEIIEKAEERYREFYTKSGNLSSRSDAPLQQAKGRRDEVEERFDELKERRENYEGDLDRYDRLKRDLSEIEDQLPTLEAEAAEAEESYERVQTLRDKLETEEARLETAEGKVEQLEGHLQRRTTLREDIEQHEDRKEEKETEIEQLRDELESHREARKELAEEKEEAEKRRDELKRKVRLLRAHLDVLSAQDRLSDIERRADDLEDLTDERDALIDELSKIQVGEDDVDHLETLKEARDEARTRLQAAAAQLRFTATGEVDVQIDGDEIALADGETEDRLVDEPTRVDVDTLRIEIEPGGEDLASIREAATDAQEEYKDALDELGVASLAEARSQQQERVRLEDRIESIRDRIANLVPEGEDLEEAKIQAENAVENAREKRSGFAEADEADSLPDEDDDVRQMLEETETDLEEANDALGSARDALQAHDDKTQTLQGDLQEAQTRMEGIEKSLDNFRRELSDHEDEHGSNDDIEDALDEARSDLAAQQETVEEIEAELDDLSPEDLEARKERTQKALESTREEKRDLEEKLNKVQGRLESDELRGLHERLEEARQKLETAQADVDRLKRQAEAAKLLYETLTECRAEARRKYLAPLREEVEELLDRFFDADDSHVEFGEQFDVQSLSRSSDGRFEFDQLSTGAKQQLSVLIRLAMARLIARERPHPVFLDDALSDTDPERFESIANILYSAARDMQIILTTCHHDRYRRLGVEVKRMQSLKESGS